MAAISESSGTSSSRSDGGKELPEEVTQGTSMTTRDELGDDDIQDDDESSCYQEDNSNPTRDTLAEGIIGLLRPSLETLDTAVVNTRRAQKELKEQITNLEDQLRVIEDEQGCPVDLEAYINKLNSAKKRIIVVNNILQGAQDRLNRVHQSCLKETAKRRYHLEPSPASTPSASGTDGSMAKLQAK